MRVYLHSKADYILISFIAGVTGQNCYSLCFRDQVRYSQWPPLALKNTGRAWERQNAKVYFFVQ